MISYRIIAPLLIPKLKRSLECKDLKQFGFMWERNTGEQKMNDTPTTDAFEDLGFLDQQMTWIDFARQLERELRSDNLTAHKMACAAGIERDTLRAEIAIKDAELADAKTTIANMTEALEAVLESPLPARKFFTLAAALKTKKEASK